VTLTTRTTAFVQERTKMVSSSGHDAELSAER
jgi:hypothetical protein